MPNTLNVTTTVSISTNGLDPITANRSYFGNTSSSLATSVVQLISNGSIVPLSASLVNYQIIVFSNYDTVSTVKLFADASGSIALSTMLPVSSATQNPLVVLNNYTGSFWASSSPSGSLIKIVGTPP